MERIDVAILAVGAFVLIASIVGVILYEPAGGTSFLVTFGPGGAEALGDPQEGSGDVTYTFPFQLNGTRAVDVHFDVAATAQGARVQADQVQVDVAGPAGLTCEGASFQMAPGPDGSGGVAIDCHVMDVPPAATLAAADETAARRAGLDANNWTAGGGTWTITITIAPGASLPGPAAPTYGATAEATVERLTVTNVGASVPEIRG